MPDARMRPFYDNVRASFLAWFRLYNHLQVVGAGHVPAEGPFLLACNHASFIDPPVFATACPRELHFFARSTLWKGPFGTVISKLNAIPIDRDGEGDLQAFRRVFATLKAGGALLVFPEGTRTPDGELHAGKKGVGMIACRAGVPVVPARVFGSYQMWNRHMKWPRVTTELSVNFGPPIKPEDYDVGKEHANRYEHAAAHIMAAIAALEDPRSVSQSLEFEPAV